MLGGGEGKGSEGVVLFGGGWREVGGQVWLEDGTEGRTRRQRGIEWRGVVYVPWRKRTVILDVLCTTIYVNATV